MQKILYTIFCLTILVSTVMAEETFVSLKKSKVNVRYGPSFDSDIKYVYKKINLPLKQIDKKENFRRIIDLKNNSGWIHISQLKKNNSVIVIQNKVLFKKPSSFAKGYQILHSASGQCMFLYFIIVKLLAIITMPPVRIYQVVAMLTGCLW